ncbi:MAG: enoyl-CoA hydratase/isomerase family protein, partial [Ignavibacteriales bacterium]
KLNHPARLNALTKQMIQDLGQVFDILEGDPNVRAIVIYGEKNFSAGADISSMIDLTQEEAKEFSFTYTFNKIELCPKPVIAAIEGYALGGGLELAMACDMQIIAPHTKMGLPEITLGIFPGAGATQRLPRLIGTTRAKYLIYTGAMIDAATAVEYGLATKTSMNPLEEALELAASLAEKEATALKLAKHCINFAHDVDSVAGIEYEAEVWSGMFDQRRTQGWPPRLSKKTLSSIYS